MIWKKSIRQLPYEIEKYTKQPKISRRIMFALFVLTYGLLLYFLFQATEVQAEVRNLKNTPALITRQIDPCTLKDVICPGEVEIAPKAQILPKKATPVLNSPLAERLRAIGGENLVQLIYRESGINPFAINKSSGACGLGQALPCSKLLKVCNTLDDVDCQIKWVVDYIHARYGTFEAANKFQLSNNWY
jgi:hypothetical protein